ADLQARALLEQVLRAVELVLVPVTGDQGRHLRERLIEMLCAAHRDHAAHQPPSADDAGGEGRGHPIEEPPPGRHASARARDLAIKGVPQVAAAFRLWCHLNRSDLKPPILYNPRFP